MKMKFYPITALLLLVLLSCQRTDNARELLEDEEDRKEVYVAILEDEEMRTEMMEMMREQNMRGPMGSGGMMQGMMGDTTGMGKMDNQQMQAHMQQMMELCDTDTAACNMMSQMMMQHKGTMASMMQHMQQRGMIDASCLQQMRRHMNR